MRKSHVVMAGFAMLAASAVAMAGPAGGTVSGKVTYEGTPAKMKPIDMSKEPSCAKMYSTPPVAETVVTGPGNALGDVVVYVSAGAPDEAAPSTAAIFTQKGCRYIPHILAFQVNQELKISNEDQTSHNIHPLAKVNSEWNKSQPPGSPPINTKWEKPEFIAVKCNIHPWMHGYFVVLKTPHYAVSGQDGSFEIKGLPAGKYTVSAWQEQYGTQTQDVTISGGENKTANFTFKVLPY